MIALPFHPSNAYTIDALYENLEDILRETELAAEKVAEGRAHFSLLDKVTADGKLACSKGSSPDARAAPTTTSSKRPMHLRVLRPAMTSSTFRSTPRRSRSSST